VKPIATKPQRCAIYTRKSTEHNLESGDSRSGLVRGGPSEARRECRVTKARELEVSILPRRLDLR
jgi:hypothetical protein